MIVVIPTNRAVQLPYLAPLIDCGARFIVVDDSEGNIRLSHPQFRVVSWADRRRLLGQREIAIPRRNGACRDFGFLLAWRESDDDEVIIALDDDCAVEDAGFAEDVAQRLAGGAGHTLKYNPAFFNILDLYDGVDGSGMFPRGFPYSHRPGYRPPALVLANPEPAAFHLGLWRGVFDVNAVDKLQLTDWVQQDARLQVPAVRIPHGTWISVCSMNMQFRRRLIPAVYQLPMAVDVGGRWSIDRYGDIWGGYILKALMDIRGDIMTAGAPMIRHLKDGSLERNILQEHAAHLVNDEFIAFLRDIAAGITPADYLAMFAQVTDGFRTLAHGASPILRRYLEHLIPAMEAWIAVLAEPLG